MRTLAVLALAAAVVLSGCDAIAAARQGSAEDAVRAVYGDLEDAAFDDAIALVRANDGAPLAANRQSEILRAWTGSFADAPFTVADVAFTGRNKLAGPDASKIRGGDALRLTFDLTGTSATNCIGLPATGLALVMARIDGRWYAVEGPDFERALLPHC